MKVIWGGPHCISMPELSLRFADGVCFSEGDQVVVDLVNKMEKGEDYINTPNMAFNDKGSYVVNDVLPPFSDLDSLPYCDYNLDNQFLLDRRLSKMTKEKVKERTLELEKALNAPSFPSSEASLIRLGYSSALALISF